jgi:hypothetical protein
VRHFLSTAIATCIFVALTSSACPALADNEKELAQVHTVAVISALGDTLHNAYIGSTAFTNAGHEMDVADWKIDDLLATEVGKMLAARFTVVPSPLPRDAFLPGVDSDGDPKGAKVEERFMSAASGAAGTPVDMYVIVSAATNDDFVGMTNQHLFGMGLYRHHGIFGGNQDAVFASCWMTLVDGHTGKEIDGVVVLVHSSEGFFGRAPAHVRVKDLWDDQFTLTADSRKQVQDSMETILRDGALYSLQRMDVLPKS